MKRRSSLEVYSEIVQDVHTLCYRIFDAKNWSAFTLDRTQKRCHCCNLQQIFDFVRHLGSTGRLHCALGSVCNNKDFKTNKKYAEQ